MSSFLFCNFQDDCNAVDEVGHRRQPTQGDHRQGSLCNSPPPPQTLQGSLDRLGYFRSG
jgi:hypothetical protein